MNEINSVRYISQLSDDVIKDLINIGVHFDKTNEGKLNYTLEAAHSVKRILHSGGDATGKYMTKDLVKLVRENKNITVQEYSTVSELLINSKEECKGLIYYNDLTGEHEIVYSSAVVLATGGLGQLYKYTTNPNGATGDGIDLAFNAGAKIQDIEFIQFHPTALALSPKSKNRFLISEAMRGEGAKLVTENGNEFMKNYHDKRELAPRDIVTRAIFSEMQSKKTNNVFLNATIIDTKKLFNRFPTITERCKENGLDITQKYIPVAPAAHYSMGGIKADVDGKTNIFGLYAIGECSSTGLHGANRLASNSLLECVVSAYEISDYLSFCNLNTPKKIDDRIRTIIDLYSQPINDNNYDISMLKDNLKNVMWDNVGIIRNEEKLNFALKEVENLSNNFKRKRKCLNREEYEYRNMLTTAKLIIQCAIKRQESRGAHCRSDYPLLNDMAKHSECIINNNERELYYAQ